MWHFLFSLLRFPTGSVAVETNGSMTAEDVVITALKASAGGDSGVYDDSKACATVEVAAMFCLLRFLA